MKYTKLLLTLGIFISLAFLYSKRDQVYSAAITSVKDSLSSSQLSYFARSGVGTTRDTTFVTIQVSGGTTGPSVTTANLFTGDTIAIGRTGVDTALDLFTMSDISNTATFSIGVSLTNVNGQTNVAIISTRSAVHTVYFQTDSPVAGSGTTSAGYFELLLKATSATGTSKAMDGIPDQDGFDLGMDASGNTAGIGSRVENTDISCPGTGGAAVNVGTTITLSGSYYHRIICAYTSTNATGTGLTMTIGIGPTNSTIINPSPANATAGTANSSGNVYTYFVRHMNGTSVVASTQGKIAVVESVRVTATIDPTITFTIGTTAPILSTGNTACGVPLSSGAPNTTATAVSFGSVSIAAFNSIAQMLSIVTNAPSGYAITTFANNQLTVIGGSTTIPPTTCDSGPCTTTSEQVWSNATNYGFGYSLENLGSAVGATFVGTSVSQKARPFPVGASSAVTIIKNTSTPTQTESYYVCYRLNPSTTQQAGTYENKITYTATATF